MPGTPRYRFGPFLLEPALHRLLRESAEITLPPKAFDILVLLVRERTRVLTKQELLDAVWPDTAVTENTLTQRIREIREALADDAQEPRYVRTVSRVGYRFVADVTDELPAPALRREPGAEPEVSRVETVHPAEARTDPVAVVAGPPMSRVRDGPAEAAAIGPGSVPPVPERPRRPNWIGYAAVCAIAVLGGSGIWFVAMRGSSVADPVRRIESIAVLPLANLSGDVGQDYFADGMTDELITELARIRTLRVISRTSALQYKRSTKSVREIGRELSADAIVEGSVLRAGDQVRISLKLVDVATDRTLLAERYARELRDILALQKEIARAVSEQIRATVAPEPSEREARRIDPEAHDDYLRARASWWKRTPEGVTEALHLFQRAIKRDPTYAAAWAGVADCYVAFGGALLGLTEQEAYPKARDAALRALALDEALAEARTSLGSVKSEYDWDWAGAEAEYTRAIAISSSYVTARQWYGEFLYFRGRHEESLAQLEQAVQLDPLSPVVNGSLARALLAARRYDEALARVQRTLEIDPRFGGAHLTLGEIYFQQRRYADAIAALERAAGLSPGLSRPVAWLGHAHGASGDDRNARRALDQLQAMPSRAPVSPYDVALVHVGLGETEQAFAWLEKAYQARASDLIQITVDRRFESLQSDPRFADLLRRVGISRP